MAEPHEVTATGLPLEQRVARLLIFLNNAPFAGKMPGPWELSGVTTAVLEDTTFFVNASTRLCGRTLMDEQVYQAIAPWLTINDVTRKRIIAEHARRKASLTS